MHRWRLALEGADILSDAAKEKLFTPHIVEEEGGDTHYCYGWVWVETTRDTTLITHNGGNDVFFADFRWYVEDEIVVILMTNAERTLTREDQRELRRILFSD
jgi:hypothetical protein